MAKRSKLRELKTLTVKFNDYDTFEIRLNGRKVSPGLMMSITNVRQAARVLTRIAVSMWYDLDQTIGEIKSKEEDK